MKTFPSPRPAANGSALIITLFFMGMITVVIVGVLISTRLERTVAHSHFDQKRASDMAREGVERVIATLDKQTAYQYAIKDPSVTTSTVYAYRYRNYLTQPGGLVVPAATPSGNPTTDQITQNILAQSVPLSTGTPSPNSPTSTDPVYVPPSLNIPSFTQQSYPTYLIDDRLATPPKSGTATTDTSKPPAMKLRWVYIHQDLKLPPVGFTAMYDDPVDQSALPQNNRDSRPNDSTVTDLPKIDPTAPIIGRFAYWTDDESAKLNYNLAWKKGPNASPNNLSVTADPSRIDLEALFLAGQSSSYFSQAQVDKLHNWATSTIGTSATPAPSPYPGRYFNSFEDARQVGQVDSSIPPVIDYNKFDLTHYNHDPDTTFFGEDRILLTTNPSLVPKNPDGSYARKFIDILREDQTPTGKDFRTYPSPPDPGLQANIAGGQSGAPSTNKLDPVVKNLVRYISQTNWPIMPIGSTASFQQKYYKDSTPGSAAVAQLAVAIIDYVRMRESTYPVVAATRFGISSGVYTTNSNATTQSSTAYQGSGRVPFCTEMGIGMETSISGGVTKCADGTSNGWPLLANGKNETLYRCVVKYEFYLPVRCGIPNGVVNFATTPQSSMSTERYLIGFIMGSDPTANRYIEGEDQKMYKIGMNGGSQDFGGYSIAISTKNCQIYKPNATGGTTLVPNATTLMPGGYAVVTIPYFREQPIDQTPIVNFAQRVQLSTGYIHTNGLTPNAAPDPIDPIGGRVLIVPQTNVPAIQKNTLFNGGDWNGFMNTLPSVETDDPRCCVAAADWVAKSTTSQSWGMRNSRWSAGTAPKPGVSPQQDTDASGIITDYSLYMPPTKIANSKDPENGRVTSVGELGYVPTGFSAALTIASVPWRTLRLQASNDPATGLLPDWAFADLFAVPNETALATTATSTNTTTDSTTEQDLHNPHGNTVGGRININSAVVPFTDVTHDRALVGLLFNANNPIASAFNTAGGGTPGTPTPLTNTKAEEIAGDIANQTPVIKSSTIMPFTYGAMNTSSTLPNPAYDTPGELCEIRNIGDQGEVGEDLIRQISSLTCTRGDVFSIYTVGQALQQSPNGKLTVTAEQRQQSMVERYVANRNTATAQDDQVRFRTVYQRNLTP